MTVNRRSSISIIQRFRIRVLEFLGLDDREADSTLYFIILNSSSTSEARQSVKVNSVIYVHRMSLLGVLYNYLTDPS